MYNSISILRRRGCVFLMSILIAFLICACNSTDMIKIKFDTKEYVNDNMSIKAQIPKFSNLSDKDFENSLNDSYETDIQSWIDEFVNNTDANVNSEFDLQQCVRHNSKNFVSIVGEIYTFTGGAHGSTTWIAKNIDTSQNKLISLGDLFKPEEDYAKEINRIILEMAETNKDEYGELWEQPILTDRQQQDFYIQDGKLVIYYHPYELSYYARGFVEFPIDLKDLTSYLKDEYKPLT